MVSRTLIPRKLVSIGCMDIRGLTVALINTLFACFRLSRCSEERRFSVQRKKPAATQHEENAMRNYVQNPPTPEEVTQEYESLLQEVRIAFVLAAVRQANAALLRAKHQGEPI